jgi:glycosyltransferase involved in cell wall biosynthesis
MPPEAPTGSTPETQLFIAGCPRSGTSALVFLLNEHPQIALGFERFKRTRAQLEPFHFAPKQFFSPVLAETDIRGELLYRRLRERWQRGSVAVVGDKVPLYWRVLPELLERFPRGRLILLVRDLRDVAASFERRAHDPEDWWPAENDHTLAVRMWSEALRRVRDAESGGYGERIFLLPYEPLLAGDERWLCALLAFIGLSSSVRLGAEHHRLAARWQARIREPAEPGLVSHVESHRDPELEGWARGRMERQLESDSPSGRAAAEDDEPPLGELELRERDREREELLAEMRSPGARAAGEAEILERRLIEQAGELVRRGDRLRGSVRPAAALRVTFILPHQRPTTGGVYVIEQFARHLSDELSVGLVVRDGDPRPVPGVAVRGTAQLHPEALPLADALIYPADMRDAQLLRELPAGLGRPVMLFQGYGTPGSPVVEANLAAAEASLAIAHWLVDVALRSGTPCAYVPQGLDRSVFAPGPATGERPPRVSLMTHRLDWKGLEDALSAVAIVRAARPDVEVTLFGTEPAPGFGSDGRGTGGVGFEDLGRGGPTSFHASPSRPEVARLLSASAVHMVSSWEEGFGLTGAEAIACGAALATTDTKGSRDYAIDGSTALVSAPRDPEALARNVLMLLEEPLLRERLIATGQRQLRTVMPPWPEAARRMALALRELLA